MRNSSKRTDKSNQEIQAYSLVTVHYRLIPTRPEKQLGRTLPWGKQIEKIKILYPIGGVFILHIVRE